MHIIGTYIQKEAYADPFILSSVHSFIHSLIQQAFTYWATPVYQQAFTYGVTTICLTLEVQEWTTEAVFAIFAICIIYSIVNLQWRSRYRVLISGEHSAQTERLCFFLLHTHHEHWDGDNLCNYLFLLFSWMVILMGYLSLKIFFERKISNEIILIMQQSIFCSYRFTKAFPSRVSPQNSIM